MEGRYKIMGILNMTPDSFYAKSRALGMESSALAERIRDMIEDGADIIDIGACSTRPGSIQVSEAEEWARLKVAISLIVSEFPGICISIDTYRAGIVERAMDMLGTFIINDISGGRGSNDEILKLAARSGLPYVATHSKGSSETMDNLAEYKDVSAEIWEYFKAFDLKAKEYGIREWILDPGFGFAKTVEQNMEILSNLQKFTALSRPILVGISRKRMAYSPIGASADSDAALQETLRLQRIALENGATIIRTHDVAATRQQIMEFVNTQI